MFEQAFTQVFPDLLYPELQLQDWIFDEQSEKYEHVALEGQELITAVLLWQLSEYAISHLDWQSP